MDGFKRRSELKRTNILQSALDLFMKFGISKVSVAEIAKNANVSQVTIYNYFGSKDKLVDEVVVYYIEEIWSEFQKIIDSDIHISEKIKQIIFNKTTSASSINEEIYNYIIKDFSSGTGSYIEEFYTNKALPELINLFDEGKEQGYIDSTISNEAILIYIQMFREYLQQKHVYEQVLPYTEELTKMFFYGIVGYKEK
ncbi:TetR/AcrR family transcriptional regulator [Ornithinibacillus sp. BX22]|uniref:TetR/AcrR family transcriptional regulator n=2 Tax=Ornithinibacillus TaxID=484508 RepID=A0A923RHW0_9BACI|nr:MULTISPECIES: TetR/AcrR family transcriptional regulator [Ornithinibacillus]MBC5636786.1 TetR/AcrR family transcriptional regulator [Ornithinibacillus hominis]MBS3681352.1 TetR/AcrR family transcriptional regulator [Ornithinibacillus massiliensis]